MTIYEDKIGDFKKNSEVAVPVNVCWLYKQIPVCMSQFSKIEPNTNIAYFNQIISTNVPYEFDRYKQKLVMRPTILQVFNTKTNQLLGSAELDIPQYI